ncbi:Spc98 family-domain-containing protein, partial [Dioszegia hungarica]
RPVFPSDLLLRDTLYLLQGIDGRYIHFARRPPKEQNPYATQAARAADGLGFPLPKGEKETPDEDDGYMSAPTRTILVQLSEMGVMYRKVTEFINTRQAGTSRGGMTEQSLCHFLHHELSEYHRLLAVLESQLSESLTSPEGPASGLTLLRLGLWTEEMKIKMRIMSEIVDDAMSAHGGALVSRIHARTRHGDPFVRRFMDQILEEVSKPFFLSLQRWIFSGDLHDPFEEFFVQLNPDPLMREGSTPYSTDLGFGSGLDAIGSGDEAGKVWEKKYVFVKAMVPGFVNEDFGKKIFSTGRSLNFIRYTCHDSEWIETQAKLANAGRALKYSDLAGLERSIDDAYAIASDRLLEIFFDKFRLLEHLRALKSYLMLGAGDFTEVLLEAISPRLAKPAISLYRHHLTSDLETAIRGSNAQYDDPDILRRLDARILEYAHGELGWDCFALEYKVEAPLNALLDSRAMAEYDRLFHHLWRVKRVEVALSSGWMKVVSSSRMFEKIPELGNNWHSARIVQAEMVHFLRQLQAFYQLEVIECSWAALMEFTAKRQGDLDSLIQAHRTYLDRVVKKVLLLGHRRDKDILLGLVQDAFEYILQFRAATDDLYAWSLTEATRLDHLRDASRGLYSTPLSTGPRSEPNIDALDNIRNRVKSAAHAFSDRLATICHLAASHPDLDIRFLAVRINFNGVFKRSSGKSRSVRSGHEGR